MARVLPRLRRAVRRTLPVSVRRRLWHLTARKDAAGRVRGLLSIVVPSYNVERYLRACLNSLTAQSYPWIEIIVVVDGATDGTERVARECATKDKRIRVVVQENQGLSGARNSGIPHARGEFLWFVDSDDTVAPHAAKTFLSALRRSGSDFAVAQYRRFNSGGTWAPGKWIQDAHRTTRLAMAPADFPDVLVNAVAWSKVYRRSFWDAMGTEFPVGALYEDQPVSAMAYARAQRVDVLADTLINWRVREDASSISQQTHEVRDLEGRLDAARSSIATLRAHADSALADARILQLLTNDLQHSARHVPYATDAFWDALSAGIRDLTADLSDEAWTAVHPHQAALEWLIREGRREDAVAYVRAGGLDSGLWETQLDDRGPYLAVALSERIDFPRSILTIPRSMLTLRTAIRAAHWEDAGTLAIDGWAFVTGLDADRVPSDVTVVLRGPRDFRLPLHVEPRRDLRIDSVAEHKRNDYTAGAWRARLDTAALESAHPERADFRVEVTVRNACGEWTETVRDVSTWGSAGHLHPHETASGARVGLMTADATRTHVQIRMPDVRVAHVTATATSLNVQMTTMEGTAGIRHLNVTGNRDTQPRRVRVHATADGWAAELPLEELRRTSSSSWGLRAVDTQGRIREISWAPAASAWPAVSRASQIAAVQTSYGNVALTRFSQALIVDALHVESETLIVEGRSGARDDVSEIALIDHRGSSTAPLTWSGNSWSARVPLTHERWGRTRRPLPSGNYRLEARTAERMAPLYMSEGAAAPLPAQFEDDRCPVRLELDPRTLRPHVILQTPLRPEERGARNQHRLKRLQADQSLPLRADTVLFRSFYGENTSCSNLGVHHELVRRGSALDLVWTVKDHSVTVPPGGRAVVAGSTEWHELLGSAKYIFDNVHQPDFFQKHPGQVVIQTLHGYPFKVAGIPYWRNARFSEERIDSFLRRHDQWDFLLSPSRYATPLLERDFPSTTATTLELGYPRNDVFFSEGADALRARTREILGIDPTQKAILYAPTYRDYLSRSELTADMVKFLDPAALARELGPEHVVLVRGHAMNARRSGRARADDNVIDVTDYPEISELCLAADAAILDFSSLRFDFALTDKPSLYLVPDLERYRDEARGFLVPYDETAPGPHVSSTAECVALLSDLGALSRDYADARAEFRRGFMELEDGAASQRMVDAVFGDAARAR